MVIFINFSQKSWGKFFQNGLATKYIFCLFSVVYSFKNCKTETNDLLRQEYLFIFYCHFFEFFWFLNFFWLKGQIFKSISTFLFFLNFYLFFTFLHWNISKGKISTEKLSNFVGNWIYKFHWQGSYLILVYTQPSSPFPWLSKTCVFFKIFQFTFQKMKIYEIFHSFAIFKNALTILKKCCQYVMSRKIFNFMEHFLKNLI